MVGKVKLSKRQVKEDKFTTFMLTSKDKLQTELEDKWQYYIIGLVVVVVLIWAVAWYSDNQAGKEVEATEAFSAAMLNYQRGEEQVATIAFTEIADNYGSTAVADQAVFMMGNLNLANRAYEDAIRAYNRYLSDYTGNALTRAAAYAGIAAAQEDQGLYAEAAASFTQAVQAYPGGPLEADYELGAVRCFVAGGDLDQAGQKLLLLEEKHAGSSQARQASRILAEKQLGE